MNVSSYLTENQHEEIEDILDREGKITAIKRTRELTGYSLSLAKDLVDQIAKEQSQLTSYDIFNNELFIVMYKWKRVTEDEDEDYLGVFRLDTDADEEHIKRGGNQVYPGAKIIHYSDRSAPHSSRPFEANVFYGQNGYDNEDKSFATLEEAKKFCEEKLLVTKLT